MEPPQVYRVLDFSYSAANWGYYASNMMTAPPPFYPHRRHGRNHYQQPTPRDDSDSEDETSSSSHASSSSSSLPSTASIPVVKRTRFLLDNDPTPKWPRDSLTGDFPTVGFESPFSTIPTTVPKPFIPTLPPVQTEVTRVSAGSQSTRILLSVSSPTAVARSPISPEFFEKPLPTPPSALKKMKREVVSDDSSSDETHVEASMATDHSLHRSRSHPNITRTETTSFNVVTGVKHVWKKATARVRTVRRHGLGAMFSEQQERDSFLWAGFAKVPVAGDPSSPGSRSINRNSAWWRSREAFIVEPNYLPSRISTPSPMTYSSLFPSEISLSS